MATFPTMYRRGTEVHNPVLESLEYTLAHNPAVRSTSEGGYVTTRARFTRMVDVWPRIRYEWLSAANKNTLAAFEGLRRAGSESFTWTNPLNATGYTVRFTGPIRFTPHEGTNGLYFRAEFGLEEV